MSNAETQIICVCQGRGTKDHDHLMHSPRKICKYQIIFLSARVTAEDESFRDICLVHFETFHINMILLEQV